jgi:hypothetical protein
MIPSGEQNLDGEPPWDGRASAGPDTQTWQSSSIFSTKIKFSFLKSNLMRQTNCGPAFLPLNENACSLQRIMPLSENE